MDEEGARNTLFDVNESWRISPVASLKRNRTCLFRLIYLFLYSFIVAFKETDMNKCLDLGRVISCLYM